MMPATTRAFKRWLKSPNNVKLISVTLVLRLHEGITNFASLYDFDKKIVENFPSVYNNSIPSIEADARNTILAEASVSKGNISSISVSRIVAFVNAAKHSVLFYIRVRQLQE